MGNGREALKEARRRAGMTQQAVADHLGISWRQYQRIEAGKVMGRIRVWDDLEDLFGASQRALRLISQEDDRR